MKLATLNDGTRDGQLAVVARDLKTAHIADGIAPTLQAALDDWDFIAPQLDALYQELQAGRARRPFDFDPARCMAPLPRAYQRVDGSAYVSHVEPAHRARGADVPPSFPEDPVMAQGCSDDLLGPMDDIVLAHEEWGIDFGAEVAVVTGDLAMGATPDDALQQVRLLVLANDVTLRHLAAAELETGCGLLQSKPATAFSPVAVTPDELGDAWRDAKVHLPLRATWNGRLVGQPDTGADMAFNFAQLVAHLCKTRKVRAGTIVGSGTVSNQDASRGYACIAAQRGLETSETGAAVTAFMRFGDTIRIEMLDAKGKSVFGAIEQTVKRLER
ncbi:fumarylacetoacetate hydrolase family protein [uncultured Massilia sp.]|uniref:fumarylacetoacetate hydrolase family protein n=1 Tax=uncultured Massilia sp. TaxID=169973 RepID=UPI0025D599F6|nr:fumarylacetoacetate hydrolase family protein [uncultured Massilia sp.]